MNAWTIVIFSALITASLLNFAKDILPGRYWYHRWWVCSWLLEGTVSERRGFWPRLFNPQRSWRSLELTKHGELLEHNLLALTTGGNAGALYRIPTDQMAGLLATVVEVVLDFPSRHPTLLKALAGENFEILNGPDKALLAKAEAKAAARAAAKAAAEAAAESPAQPAADASKVSITPEDLLESWIELKADRELTPTEDIELLLLMKGGFREAFVNARLFDSANETPFKGLAGKSTPEPFVRSRSGILTDARTRVTQRMNRRLDALQSQARTWWHVYTQVLALAVGIIAAAAFSGVTMSATDLTNAQTLFSSSLFRAVMLGAAAGVLAPICDDILSIVRRFARTNS